MIVYKNHLLCNIARSELFGVITVAFEYKKRKLKIFGSFDKKKPVVFSISQTHYLNK